MIKSANCLMIKSSNCLMIKSAAVFSTEALNGMPATTAEAWQRSFDWRAEKLVDSFFVDPLHMDSLCALAEPNKLAS